MFIAMLSEGMAFLLMCLHGNGQVTYYGYLLEPARRWWKKI